MTASASVLLRAVEGDVQVLDKKDDWHLAILQVKEGKPDPQLLPTDEWIGPVGFSLALIQLTADGKSVARWGPNFQTVNLQQRSQSGLRGQKDSTIPNR